MAASSLVTLLSLAQTAAAGDCPLGYEWSPRFVGCVQSNCGSVEHAHLSYTGGCVCGSSGAINENPEHPNKECSRPSDDPSCPNCVFACVRHDQRCPGEKPPQRECDEYCTSYHGPHSSATSVPGRCDCSCKDGYVENDTLLCIPTDATCTRECNEYHGTDRAHGEQAVGTPSGVGCDCNCAPGYQPDESLVCKPVPKAATCDDICLDEMGEGGRGSGIPPSCSCYCDKTHRMQYAVRGGQYVETCIAKRCFGGATVDPDTGDCRCPEGYHPKPFDDECIPIKEGSSCGNGDCEGVVPYGDPPEENCRTCPQDCACPDGKACDPDTPGGGGQPYGCYQAQAEIIDVVCGEVQIIRKSGGVHGKPGMWLQDGDVIEFRRTLLCGRPHITLEWGGVRGRMFIGDDAMAGTITIGKDAVASGWPSKLGSAAKETGWVLWELVKTAAGPITSIFLSSSPAATPDDIRIYVNSHFIIRQTSDGVTVFTFEGEPEVEYHGTRVKVTKGRKVTIAGGAMSEVSEFAPYEPRDWHLRAPWCPAGHDLVDGNCVLRPAIASAERRASATGASDAPNPGDKPGDETGTGSGTEDSAGTTAVVLGFTAFGLLLLVVVVVVIRANRRSSR